MGQSVCVSTSTNSSRGYAVTDVHGEDPYLIDCRQRRRDRRDKYPYDEPSAAAVRDERQLQIDC